MARPPALVADIQLYPSQNSTFGESGLPSLNLPGENDCARTKPDSWRNGFTAAELQADIIVSCIFTAEKDFGYLVVGHNWGYAGWCCRPLTPAQQDYVNITLHNQREADGIEQAWRLF